MVEEKENNKKNIIKSILAIIIYFSGSTVLLFILDFLHINLNKLSKTNVFLIETIYELTILLIVFFIFKDTIIKNAKIYFKYIKGFMRRYIKYWLISLGITYVCNLILFFITKGIANNEEAVRKLFDINQVIMIIL